MHFADSRLSNLWTRSKSQTPYNLTWQPAVCITLVTKNYVRVKNAYPINIPLNIYHTEISTNDHKLNTILKHKFAKKNSISPQHRIFDI